MHNKHTSDTLVMPVEQMPILQKYACLEFSHATWLFCEPLAVKVRNEQLNNGYDHTRR